MKALEDQQCTYRDGIERTWKFSRFEDRVPGDFLLAPSRIDPKFDKGDKKLVYYVIEEPNGFFSPKNLGYYHKVEFYDKVLTVCPYSAEWFNKKYDCDNKWEYVFFPFNKDRTPDHGPKLYDVIYVGNLVSSEVHGWVHNFRSERMDYRVISTHRYNETTDCEVNYDRKMQLISQSKVAVIHNVLYPRQDHMDTALRLYPDLVESNEGFRLCTGGKANIVPQLKSRTFETAFSKTLMLCRRDPWNLIEDYFVPGEDFLYFDEGGMLPVLQEALANYDKYKPMIESAYKKAVENYTVEKFVDKHLVNLSI